MAERTFIPAQGEPRGMKEGEDPESWDALFDQAASFDVTLQDIQSAVVAIRDHNDR